MLGVILAAMLMSAEPGSTPATSPAPVAAPAGPAAAPGSSAQAQVTAAGPEKVHRDQLLCKSEQVLGSLIPKKVCYTREQQEQREQEDRSNLDRQQRSQYMTHQP